MKKQPYYVCGVCGDVHHGEHKIEGLEQCVTQLVQCVIVLKKRIEGLEERERYTGKE